jgi:dTDP-4-amino-4,6-dideoxygalactose transaminase
LEVSFEAKWRKVKLFLALRLAPNVKRLLSHLPRSFCNLHFSFRILQFEFFFSFSLCALLYALCVSHERFSMKVPFLDLKAQYESIKDEINTAIQAVLESSAFAGGPFVAQFEKDFANFCGCKHAIGVGSGTEALWMSLLALGIGPGDEVITVPNTFIATAEAISFCGATPVFVDIEEKTYNLDPNKLEDYLKKRFSRKSQVASRRSISHLTPHTSRLTEVNCAMRSAGRPKAETHSGQPSAVSGQQSGVSSLKPRSSNLGPGSPRPRAVIPVHLFGQPADMDPILEIAKKYNLAVIEDACQAHGAEYKGKRAGSLGDTGCFSFYPGKNLGAYGEAGAVVTNDDYLAGKLRMLRDHGQPKKYYHDLIGWNGRMDGIQGSVLSVKLKHLPAWNEARRKKAQLYSQMLSGADGVALPKEADYAKHIYHIYALRVPARDKIMNALAEKGIGCGIHYPVPVHLTDAYRSLGLGKGSFPVAEKCAEEFVSLPMFPELTEEQIKYVCDEIKRITNN